MNHRKGYLTAAEAARSKAARVPGAVIEEGCRCGLVHVNPPAAPPDPDRNSGPSAAVRALVLARDGRSCVCCGLSVTGRPHSLGHRLRASQQGKPVASNLLTFLGFGVNPFDPDDHHARIDSRRDPSDEARGYTIRSWRDPLLVPVAVFSPDGTGLSLWLDDSGKYLPVTPGGSGMTGPEPYFSDDMVTVHLGDCLDVLAGMEAESIDAVVCDPPYALTELPLWAITDALSAWLSGDRAFVPATSAGFMGRDWDKFVPPPAAWDECLRVLKPGGWLLAFAAPRTQDLMGISIRLAGFRTVDAIEWIFGSGWPKGKACLKPAHEPVIMARKPARRSEPLPGLESCKVAFATAADLAGTEGKNRHAGFASGPRTGNVLGDMGQHPREDYDGSTGRWPPNVLLSHAEGCRPAGTREVPGNGRARKKPAGAVKFPGAYGSLVNDRDRAYGLPGGTETIEVWECAGDCPVAALDSQAGERSPGHTPARRSGAGYGSSAQGTDDPEGEVHHEPGSVSRFFPVFRYQAKAPQSERPRLADGTTWPAVKPLELMRWLVRLVTPPGGTVLDFCAGTGTTGEACIVEGFPCVLVEKDPVAAELIMTRLRKPIQPDLFGGAA